MKENAKYPKNVWSLKYFQISLTISWPLVNFCRVCWVAHVSHKGSGSLQDWQKYVALTCLFSKEHGTHVNSFKLESSLKENSNLLKNALIWSHSNISIDSYNYKFFLWNMKKCR